MMFRNVQLLTLIALTFQLSSFQRIYIETKLYNNISGMVIELSIKSESDFRRGIDFIDITGVSPDANINVDEVTKLDLGNTSLCDTYFLRITNITLPADRSYGELLSKLGLNSSYITDAWIKNIASITIKNLKDLKEITSLDIDVSDLINNSGDPELSQIFPNLESITIKSQNLQILPSITGLRNLNSIYIYCPNLEKLPEIDYENITSTGITTSKTQSSNICDGKPKLKYIQDYEFEGNVLPVFGICPELKILAITGSTEKFHEMSDELLPEISFEMPSVTYIALGYIHIHNITKRMFEKTLNLNELNLSDNDIKFIEEGAFGHLSELEVIDVSYNKLLIFSMDLLPPKLIYLYLSYNNLSGSFYLEDVSKKFPNLSDLYLRGNQLTSFKISGSLDVQTDYGIYIDLSENQLETLTIPESFSFEDLTTLELDLNLNNLQCDCDLKPFIEMLQQKNSKVILKKDWLNDKYPECEIPKGENLKEIDLEKIEC